MTRRSQAFNQRRPRRQERKRLLVVTEGKETEVQYLEGLAQFLRSSGVKILSVRPKGVGKDPVSVLQAGIDFNHQDADGYDEIWALVDVDEHKTLDEALKLGRRLPVSVVVSNPCFEIWLIWHYEDCAAYHSTREAIKRLRNYGHSEKDIPNSFPYQAYVDAIRRAGDHVELCQRGPNPSTAMPRLLAALRGSPLT